MILTRPIYLPGMYEGVKNVYGTETVIIKSQEKNTSLDYRNKNINKETYKLY